MSNSKAPVRVNDIARPESDPEQAISDLIEVVKRNGDFRKYGPNRGALLYMWTTYWASPPRPSSFLRPGWLVALLTFIVGAWKFWMS